MNLQHGILRVSFMGTMMFVIGLTGCTAGQEVIAPPPVLVQAIVDYEGNVEYLPRTIEKVSDSSRPLVARYRYEVEQGREDGTDFFVPLLNKMVGGRSGRWVIAVGQLDLLHDEKNVMSFKAVRDLGSSGVSGRSLTELRRAALLLVRQELEQQMLEAVKAGKLKLN